MKKGTDLNYRNIINLTTTKEKYIIEAKRCIKIKSDKYYAYMVRCSDNSIYSGYTVNLEKRLETHNSGKGAKYTRTRLPVKLEYYEEFDNKIDACKKEWQFKQYTHAEKEKIIKNNKNFI